MKTDITKTIAFRFTNKFTKQMVMVFKTPYLPFKAANGYYSNLYKSIVKSSFYDFERKLLQCKISYDTKKISRTIITFPNRVSLDMPYNVTKKDIKIIKHYLEGLKMSVES